MTKGNQPESVRALDASPSDLESEVSCEANLRRTDQRVAANRVPQRNPKFQLMTPNEIEALDDPEWLIDGILPKGGLAVLYGEPGTGKSFLALDWGNSIATGEPSLEREVKAEDVVYVYAEGARGLKFRRRAWCKARGAKLERIRFLPEPVNMSDSDMEGDVDELIKAIRAAAFKPGLIIVDTVARCFGSGDENGAKDMNAFVAGIDALRDAFPDATVLVVHHSGKDPTRGGRGHSALRAAADTEMRLSNKKGVLTLSCEKQKDAEEFDDVALRLITVELDGGHSSCVIEAILPTGGSPVNGAKSADPRARTNDQRVLVALAGFGPNGANHSEWLGASGLAKSTFNDRLSRLIETKEVIREGRTYRIAQAGPKAESGPEQGRKVTPQFGPESKAGGPPL